MIITRTPYRISFFGGGTDYPVWYRHHGGAVLAAAIDKYCYISCRYLPPFFKHKLRIVWSKIENTVSVDEVTHPAAREILKYCKVRENVEIHYDGDLPARSGIGSSSAFTVGLLHALSGFKGEHLGERELANQSIRIEQRILKETVGCQDQIMAAYGGVNLIKFQHNGEFSVERVKVNQGRLEELRSYLMLVYTGISRTASQVAGRYINGIDQNDKRVQYCRKMVDESMEVLSNGRDLKIFGQMLHESWANKKSLSRHVSNARIDEIYEEAMASGALGGKLLGAGGGGFMLFFVPPDRQRAVVRRLRNLLVVPFHFDFTGSQIIFSNL